MKPEQIKEIRNALKMTQEEFATIISNILKLKKTLSKKTIYNWEKGNRSPRGKYLATLEALQKKSGDIFHLLVEEKQKNLDPDPAKGTLVPSENKKTSDKITRLLEINNARLYQGFREVVVSGKDFQIHENEKWPAVDIPTKNKKLKAKVELRPDPQQLPARLSNEELVKFQEKMSEYLLDLSDLSADVLDITSYIWLQKAEHEESMVVVTADEFLAQRGLKSKKAGNNRRGGFEDKQREKISLQLDLLSNTWITVLEMEIIEEIQGKNGPRRRRKKWRGASKAVVVTSVFGPVDENTDALTPYVWKIRPGDVFAKFLFGPGRQTALLSQKALEYNTKTQKFEKRLTRYFAYQWRIRYRNDYFQPFTVATLLEAVREEINTKRPNRTRDRLEKALDRLLDDQIISGWQYENYDEKIVNTRNWGEEWLTWKIIVEPPQEIMEQYGKIKQPKPKQGLLFTISENTLGDELKEFRLRQGLTQMQAAEDLGLSQSEYSKIERGKKFPKDSLRKKIRKWIGNENECS